MADGHFATLISKDRDANTSSNCIFTQLADNGGNAVTVTGNKLDVNASVSLETAYVDDAAFTIATDKVNAQGFLADDTSTDSVDEGDIGLARMTLNRIQLGVICDPSTDSQRLGIDASGYITSNINGTVTVDCNSTDVTIDNAAGAAAVNIQDGGNSITVDGTVAVSSVAGTVTVTATDLDIRDLTDASDKVSIGDGTDTLGINSDGSINVNVVSSAITGEVCDYDTQASLASDTTDNHDYTVANTTMLLKRVIFSCSGGGKAEIQVGPLASLVTKAVIFVPKHGGTERAVFDPPIEVPATSTGTVRVIRTNRQGTAQDVYSSIIGQDI